MYVLPSGGGYALCQFGVHDMYPFIMAIETSFNPLLFSEGMGGREAQPGFMIVNIDSHLPFSSSPGREDVATRTRSIWIYHNHPTPP